jgi:hypothetical protein
MKQLYALLILGFAFTACQTSKETTDTTSTPDSTMMTSVPPIELTKKWESDTVLTTCESVLFDKENNILYVSNINGNPEAKDGNGTIAKLSLDGKVIDAAWAKGFDAPKGLGQIGSTLYVTDIDRVHEVDVKTGKISKTHKVAGAQFLNDVTTSADGKVYISDSNVGTISIIENGKLSTWTEKLAGPNGLLAEDGKLLTVLWTGQTFNSMDLTSKAVTVKADSIENGDGIEALGDGSYLVSSWNGMIHHIAADGTKSLILDTREDSVNSADIEFIQELNLLLVPTFFKNKVVAYDLKKN